MPCGKCPVQPGRSAPDSAQRSHPAKQQEQTGETHEPCKPPPSRRPSRRPRHSLRPNLNCSASRLSDCSGCRMHSSATSTRGPSPGVTVMVARARPDRLVRGAGKANPAASAPMAQNSIFRIFSMTKPIVSVGIMMLLEEGHFLLSDAISKFIPEFADQKVGVEQTASSIWHRWRGRLRFRICCGTLRASLTIIPAIVWYSSCISSRDCAAARSAMPSMPPWSLACRCCASRAPSGTTAAPPTFSAASSRSSPAKA